MTPSFSNGPPSDNRKPASTDGALDAGLAVAFGLDRTGGWTQPPLLRDDPSDFSPVVRPDSDAMHRADAGRYQLLGEIARGGMGVVIKGRDPDLGRDLAFKVLKAELAGRPAAEQRFVEEAQVGGQLQHPGVVPVYELGRFGDGRPYFTMKLVKGRTLADLLAERPEPAYNRGLFLKVFEQVCQTLAYAHSKGVIHRDIKPANIMVGAFGEVQVMDWGLAKVLPRGGVADEEKATRATVRPELPEATIIRTVRSGGSSDGTDTEAGSMLGTPAFMPPEQAGGELDKLDERADVFGLGAVLCVILTGKPPYVGPTGDAVRLLAVRGKLDECFTRLAECGADTPLIELCKKCLAPEPAERPRDAGRVAEAVTAYQTSVAERLQKAEVGRAEERVRLVEERRRRKVLLALAASVLVIVVAGGGGGFWLVEQRRTKATRTDMAIQGAEMLKEQAAGDPENPVGRWQDAEAAVKKAEGVLGDDAAPEAKTRLMALEEAIAAGLKEAKGNRNLLDQLDRIRNEKEGAVADKAFADAFREAGLDVDALTIDEVKARLAAKPAAVRSAAVPAIEIWAMFRRDAANEPGLKHLFAVARAVDPDPWRNELRTALQTRDLVALHKLAEKAVQVDQQGPVHLWLLGLGHALNGDNKGATDVLRPAQRKHPGDYSLNMELASALQDMQRGGAGSSNGLSTSTNPAVYELAEPFMRAAVALRPDLARARLGLAVTLLLQDRFPEAEPDFLAAIRLDPKDSNLLTNYGSGLKRAQRLDESDAQYRKALLVNPTDSWAQTAVEAELKK
jgi:serine/threonine-protein kinase